MSYLNNARHATTGREAYDAFEGALKHEDDVTIVTYLVDPYAPHKRTLLGCMADLDVTISDPIVVVLCTLLSASDIRLALSAVILLPSSQAIEALQKLPDNERRRELEHFRKFYHYGD